MKKITLLSVMAVLCLNFGAMAQTMHTLKGKLIDANTKEPLAGALIKLKAPAKTIVTNNEGYFELLLPKGAYELQVQYLAYGEKEISINMPTEGVLLIQLSARESNLNEVVVIAYGTTTRKLNTGAVGKLSAKEIEQQPVGNVLMALIGRVPGLEVTQGSGVSGAGLKVQIRGQNSIMQEADPLFIIDGIPFVTGNSSIATLSNATGTSGTSPFNLIDPADIDRIEVLKDADATAIYGSRGANGVVLITTKKWTIGKVQLNVNLNQGFSHITRSMDMLNTAQYLAMRKEAFANDGATPTAATAPDLLGWSQSRYTDFKDLLISGTASTRNMQATLKGGTAEQNYLLSGSNYHETTVFPSKQYNSRYGLRFNLNQQALNKRLLVSLNASYTYNDNRMGISDLTYYLNMPPNLSLTDAQGNLNWTEAGTNYTGLLSNPLALTNLKYIGKFQNLTGGININWTVAKGLAFKSNFGYSGVITNDQTSRPATSINPFTSTLPSANFGKAERASLIAEPSLSYQKQLGKSRFSALLGYSIQQINSASLNVSAENYLNDDLLGAIAAAGRITANNDNSEYRYLGTYFRLNYNLDETILINASGRRDGTSRFGPGKKFGNFGAIGAAWIFWNEKATGLLNFGKLRSSYGITGNDQIGNYKYLDTWTPSSQPYQAQPGLLPNALLNENFSWETTKKLELALELGLLQNKLLLTSSYYINRSSNQLINYKLPIHTGFPSVLKNLDAQVQNKGFELILETKNSGTKGLIWNSSFNISVARNKLLRFPDLETSSYANSYIIGQALSAKRVYAYTGVDTQTGLYTFVDVNGDGLLDIRDRELIINSLPRFTGGLSNSFKLKNIQLDIFLQFKKQLGLNYLFTQASYVPGYYYLNHPVIIEQRWRKPGDVSNIQRLTSAANTPAYVAAGNHLRSSAAVYSDASFIRLKNVSFSYQLPSKKLSNVGLSSLKVFCQAQNLLTITNYLGADPENQNLYVLPPLRTINFGINLTF